MTNRVSKRLVTFRKPFRLDSIERQWPAGNYTIVVEASREVGGREVVRVPFKWAAKGNATVRGQGKSELGAVSATIKR